MMSGTANTTLNETADMLYRAGHTEAKAAEIALAAKRGDPDATAWVSNIRKAVEDGAWPLTRHALSK